MENIVKIAAIAISAALCAVAIKRQVPEIGLVLSISAGAIILCLALPSLKSLLQLAENLSETAQISPAVLKPVIKTIGIAVITKITAEICRDAKEGAVASFVEIAGAGGALLVCIPLMESVLAMLTGLL